MSDLKDRSMMVTRKELSHMTPAQEQKLSVFQVDGVGKMEVDSFDMAMASSAVEKERSKTKEARRKRRW